MKGIFLIYENHGEGMENKEEILNEPSTKTRINKVIFYIVSSIIVLILIMLLTAVAMTRKSSEPPIFFGHRLFVVTTNSMQPEIPVGSAIFVKKIDVSKLKSGDIITFKEGYDSNNNLIFNTHRIIKSIPKENDLTFITKGDNNNIEDSKIRYSEDIYGKVVLISPKFGGFLVFLKSPLGLVVCIALPLLLLLVFEIINLLKMNKMPKESFADDDVKKAHMFGTHTKHKMQKVDKKISVKDEIIDDNDQENKTNVKDETFEKKDKDSEDNINNNINKNIDKILTKADDIKDGYDQGYKIETKNDEKSIINNMNGFALLREKKIVTKKEEEEEKIKLLDNFDNGENQIAIMTNSESNAFNATMQTKGKDRFIIDGIDVKVEPQSLNLGLEDEKGREILITVTKEYTNVVVECKDYEINFALFKDKDEDEKVVIKRKDK